MSDAAEMPRFVVVGRVNRGKSSLVSTLAADASVRIDAQPGTTREVTEYPMRLDGQTLYTLVDTPGFERARHALAWLRDHETSTAERRRSVEQFVEAHAGTGRFEQECALLGPILDGGVILYVVDGSVPFSPTYEAETEILRWTGQPRMALINPISGTRYVEEWTAVLDQYFSLVRVFDTHHATPVVRVALLRTLSELVDEFRPALERAARALELDWAARRRESANQIADALVELLRHTKELRLLPEDSPESKEKSLCEGFLDELRERELRLRRALREVYQHGEVEIQQETIDRVENDLFDESTWNRLGLSLGQLMTGGTMAGAATGAGLDLALGGSSFWVGSLVGAAVGAASTFWGWKQMLDLRVLGLPLGGRSLRVGPVRDANFGWIVLDRALLLQRELERRAHAQRAPLELSTDESRVQKLSTAERRPIDVCLSRLRRRNLDGRRADETRRELADAIEIVLDANPPG